MYTFLCEDSISGIFSGIYEAWAGRYNRQEVFLKTGGIGNYELFMEYKTIDNSLVLGQKVARSIKTRFGEETYEWICYALWSWQEDKANAVYQMVRYGIEHKFGFGLKNHLTEPSIQRVMEIGLAAYNEAHHYLGFVRFEQLESGILYAKINAKNYVLELLADHFADRLPAENWVIHDESRKKAVIHPSLGEWLVTDETSVKGLIRSRRTESDEEYRNMWRRFCESISIEARKNTILQRQNFPLRFRGDLP
ncbi:MAG: DNA metabolism protein [Lachnospiraceae bacterium]|nr:DNA metabolism protein [Lachnospiraceae bacterium]